MKIQWIALAIVVLTQQFVQAQEAPTPLTVSTGPADLKPFLDNEVKKIYPGYVDRCAKLSGFQYEVKAWSGKDPGTDCVVKIKVNFTATEDLYEEISNISNSSDLPKELQDYVAKV